MSPVSIIEHLVLFKARGSADPSSIAAMLSSLRSLSSLPLLHHLAAGPIRSPSADFTHLLHTRFPSQPDLAAYAIHPSHLAVVRRNAPVVEDVLAVDWVADLDDNRVVPPAGSAMRFLIAKPREGTKAGEIVEAVGRVGAAEKVSRGVNFSPARAKGYEVGVLVGFSGVEEMDGEEGDEVVEAIEKMIVDLVESVVVVDFVV